MTDRQLPSPSSVALAAAPARERLLRDERHLRVISTIYPPGLRVEGEIDFYSRDVLAAELDEAVHFGSGDLHVDLAGVTFIDVSGIRMMTTVAKTLDRTGRRLLLHAASPCVHKVLHILGWEMTPGLMHCIDVML